jgi:hypothetical protein
MCSSLKMVVVRSAAVHATRKVQQWLIGIHTIAMQHETGCAGAYLVPFAVQGLLQHPHLALNLADAVAQA